MLKYIIKIKCDKRKLHLHVQCACTMNNWIQRGLWKKHKIFNNIAIQCSRNVNHWNGTLTFCITTTHNFYAFGIEKKQDLSRDMNKNKTPCPISFLFPVPFAFWPCDLWVMHHYIVAIKSVPFILVTVIVFWVGGIQGSETGRHCQSTLTASLQSVMVISKNVSY